MGDGEKLKNMKNDFTHDLMKGKIAELVFELMFRESGKFTTLRFGYEYTLPELAQFQHLVEVKKVLENIHNAPDFILISNDKKEVYIVEVKYRSQRKSEEIKEIATNTLKTWDPSWLFIASPDGFFFEPCHTIERNGGNIGTLYDKWVPKNIITKYLEVLNDFEKEE